MGVGATASTTSGTKTQKGPFRASWAAWLGDRLKAPCLPARVNALPALQPPRTVARGHVIGHRVLRLPRHHQRMNPGTHGDSGVANCQREVLRSLGMRDTRDGGPFNQGRDRLSTLRRRGFLKADAVEDLRQLGLASVIVTLYLLCFRIRHLRGPEFLGSVTQAQPLCAPLEWVFRLLAPGK